MTGPLKLRLGDRTVWIVRPGDVVSWSRDQASSLLREVARAWPDRATLVRLSEQMLGPDDDRDGALVFLADALDRGRLLAVRLPDAGAGLSTAGADAWEDAPLLSDLGTDDDDDERTAARTTPVDPWDPIDGGDAVDPAATFVAFAVFDQHGKPLGGRAQCKIDAAQHASALAGNTIDIRPVPPHAHVELTLLELRAPHPSQ